MIFLIAYASVAVVMIGVQMHRFHDHRFDSDPQLNNIAWFFASVVTALVWPLTLCYLAARLIGKRPPACACGLRGRKGGRFCARCGTQVGAKYVTSRVPSPAAPPPKQLTGIPRIGDPYSGDPKFVATDSKLYHPVDGKAFMEVRYERN